MNKKLSLNDLNNLEWSTCLPLKEANINSKNEDILKMIVDFGIEKPILSVYIEPQGTIIDVVQPTTVEQMLTKLQHVVQVSDDCKRWVGIQKMSPTAENICHWKLLCNNNDEPFPDFVILLEE